MAAGSMASAARRTGAGCSRRPAASARYAPTWKLARHGRGPSGATSARNFPWNIGLTKTMPPASRRTAMQSVISARPNPAASAGAKSRD